jgi:hypothetical protein
VLHSLADATPAGSAEAWNPSYQKLRTQCPHVKFKHISLVRRNESVVYSSETDDIVSSTGRGTKETEATGRAQVLIDLRDNRLKLREKIFGPRRDGSKRRKEGCMMRNFIICINLLILIRKLNRLTREWSDPTCRNLP